MQPEDFASLATRLERIDAVDRAAVEASVDVATSGFFSDGQPLSEGFWASALRALRLPQGDSFVARLDGRRVGAGGCQGVQQALSVARLPRARAPGSTLASIVAHPGVLTERNAGRLGFRTACVRAILVRPGGRLAPSP
jgi:hypothetical protein